MSSLEDIKVSLDSNTNLNDEIRDRLYGLTVLFNKKFSEVKLDTLVEKLKTVKFGKISSLENYEIYQYNPQENKILFSKEIKSNYDINNIFMKSILEMATSKDKFTGFASDERLRAFNLAYTEILANYIIGNEGDSDLEEEMLITNLLSHIVGKDTLFNSYFSNDGEPIIKAMQSSEVGLL